MQPLWKVIWIFLKNFKIELPRDLAISFIGIYPKEMKTGYQRVSVLPYSLQHYSQQPRLENNLSLSIYISTHTTLTHTHTHTHTHIGICVKYYSVKIKKEILPFLTTQIDLEGIISEIRQTEKSKYCMNEIVWQHHQLNGHKLEQTPGDSGGQRSLTCYSPQDHKESDLTQQLNNNNKSFICEILKNKSSSQKQLEKQVPGDA